MRCECADPQCPCDGHDFQNHATGGQCYHDATETLYRVDMEDRTGTPMCEECAEDSYASGLFVGDRDDREDTDYGGAFDGFTVTSDADPGL